MLASLNEKNSLDEGSLGEIKEWVEIYKNRISKEGINQEELIKRIN